MPFKETPIKDLLVFEPTVLEDTRGYFFEAFNARTFKDGGIETPFVQDNQAFSKYGVLRGLHYQTGPYAQSKIVRVIHGEVLDVAVDLREKSPTYGQWFKIRLSAENRLQLFIPRGFAHGYLALSPTAEFFYKCDNYYARDFEGGIIYNDPGLAIDWEIPAEDIILSPKDEQLPLFGNHRKI